MRALNTAVESVSQSASDATTFLKITPPAAVSGLTLVGAQLPLIVQIITAVYVVFQLYFLLRDKWWRERNKKD